ncbi:Cysteine dioxygenase type 1 [Blattella germanica]|nr:Cysteine dioxygenase type 1 [Blattella germanica]
MEIVQHNYTNICNNSPCMKLPATGIVSLQDLIRELHSAFESDSVNIEYVQHLMSSYKSRPVDWKKYAKFDRYRYTRNLVDEGNGKFNLMILCWGEGHGSAIHDHADAHCFMKVMQGSLAEVRFEFPKDGQPDTTMIEDENEDSGLKEIARTRLNLNEVCYINDSLGLHRIENPSNIDPAVSLHLYCPPFDSCNVFNQRTGQRTPCKVTFWSKFGEKRNREIQAAIAPEDN